MNAEVLEVATKAVQIYAESHPRPPHVNITQAADMLGLSRKTVTNRVKAGEIRINALGLIPIGEIDRVISSRFLHRGQ
jgi:DNA-binding NtrC family response regulator